MEIRKTRVEDIDVIMDIYAQARLFMQETGNKTQWVNGYPLRETILNDISEGYSYVCVEDDGRIVASFYFRIGDDITYAKIYDGEWPNDDSYGVIHRLGSTKASKGVSKACFDWCFGQHPNIRVDTHRDNIVMQTILKKYGFQPCGIIYLENGSERIAFHKCNY